MSHLYQCYVERCICLTCTSAVGRGVYVSSVLVLWREVCVSPVLMLWGEVCVSPVLALWLCSAQGGGR